MSDTARPKTVGDKLSAAEINDDLPIVLTAGATINGATLPVACYIKNADEEIYACDANDTDALKFIGFAISNSTDGNDITFQTKGIVSGFTGLTVASNYYVQDDKTIGTSKGTYYVIVGIAISATELLIVKNEMSYSNGQTSFNVGGSTTPEVENIPHGLGRIPKKIKLSLMRDRDESVNIILATYNGVTASVIGKDYFQLNGYITGGSTIIAYGNASSTYATGTITFDETNIIITWVRTGNLTGGTLLYILWEAEV